MRAINELLPHCQQHDHSLQRSQAWRDLIACLSVKPFIKTTHYSLKRLICSPIPCFAYWSYKKETFLFQVLLLQCFGSSEANTQWLPVKWTNSLIPDKASGSVWVPGGDGPYDCVDGGVFIHLQKVHRFGKNRRLIRIINHDLHGSCVLEGPPAAGLGADVGGLNFQGVGSLALIV